jgi:hypothetical protein
MSIEVIAGCPAMHLQPADVDSDPVTGTGAVASRSSADKLHSVLPAAGPVADPLRVLMRVSASLGDLRGGSSAGQSSGLITGTSVAGGPLKTPGRRPVARKPALLTYP